MPGTPLRGRAGQQGAGARWRAINRPAYRVWQVWRMLAPRPLDEADRAVLTGILPDPAQQLFATMSPGDQRHSLDVYQALLTRGCTDVEMLVAALLHDSGKGDGRVRFWVRPQVVILRALAPGLLRWLARAPRPWWRRPYYFAWRHAEVGAELAAAAGLPERVVLLIRTHHLAHGPAAELHAVDEEM